MDSEKKQEFDQEQRAAFAGQFRRHHRFQIFIVLGGILFYFVHFVVILSAGAYEESWGYGLLVLFGAGLVCWRSAWKHNRCPACDHFFGLRPPTRTQAFCAACGSRLTG